MCQKIRIALASLLVFSLIGFGRAQEVRRIMRISPDVFLLLRKDVQADLHMPEKQVAAVKEAFGDSVQSDGDKIMVRLSGDDNIEDMIATAREALDEKQKNRLVQIWLQVNGFLALSDKSIAKQLALSEAQQLEIEKQLEEMGNEMDKLMHGPRTEEGLERAETLRKSTTASLGKVLTDAQRQKFETMKGSEFKRAKKD